VEKKGNITNGENSPSISDFAELAIQGLSTRNAVRHYYNDSPCENCEKEEK
jgi:hypothetical protein